MPHFDAADFWQAITYRLADAMPQKVVDALDEKLLRLPQDDRNRERRKRVDAWVDAGHGSCLLQRPEVAKLILDTWNRFAGDRYDLGAWVIMPNHVHLLIRTNPGHLLKRIVGSWKSFTAKRIMQMTGKPAPIWWPDYWDRYIRDDAHWQSTVAYIENNPVAAGLVGESRLWQWSSASHKG